MNVPLVFLAAGLWLASAACTRHAANEPGREHPPAVQAPSASAELARVYALAIADYIRAVKNEYGLTYDTLYIGKRAFGQPDDFPDITLPDTIERVAIRLITPEAGQKSQQENKSRFYINLIGWVEPDSAGFIFVAFSNGFEHQFDCSLDYTFDQAAGRYVRKGLRFENFAYRKG